MFNITGIDHIGIQVSELSSARKFYEKLGFVFIEGPSGPEPIAIMDHPCGVVINFILNADNSTKDNILMDIPSKHAGFTHIALRVDDLNSRSLRTIYCLARSAVQSLHPFWRLCEKPVLS